MNSEQKEDTRVKNREIIEKILAYHPDLGPDYKGCDDWKCGDPERECTGVITAMVATMNVIRETIRLGANLIIVHEPTFYTSEDGPGWFEDFPNAVYEEKRKLLDDNGITIWRDHDHMHIHNPDGIFTGVIKYMGWEGRAVPDFDTGSFGHYIIDLPEEITLEALCRQLIDTIGLNGLRYIGDPKAKLRRAAIVGHLFPGPCTKKRSDGAEMEYGNVITQTLEERVDVILPGEVIDWTTAAYVRDAVQQGRAKAMINMGHMNWEELGMKYAKDWISELLGGAVSVTYVPSEDMYSFS